MKWDKQNGFQTSRGEDQTWLVIIDVGRTILGGSVVQLSSLYMLRINGGQYTNNIGFVRQLRWTIYKLDRFCQTT